MFIFLPLHKRKQTGLAIQDTSTLSTFCKHSATHRHRTEETDGRIDGLGFVNLERIQQHHVQTEECSTVSYCNLFITATDSAATVVSLLTGANVQFISPRELLF